MPYANTRSPAQLRSELRNLMGMEDVNLEVFARTPNARAEVRNVLKQYAADQSTQSTPPLRVFDYQEAQLQQLELQRRQLEEDLSRGIIKWLLALIKLPKVQREIDQLVGEMPKGEGPVILKFPTSRAEVRQGIIKKTWERFQPVVIAALVASVFVAWNALWIREMGNNVELGKARARELINIQKQSEQGLITRDQAREATQKVLSRSEARTVTDIEGALKAANGIVEKLRGINQTLTAKDLGKLEQVDANQIVMDQFGIGSEEELIALIEQANYLINFDETMARLEELDTASSMIVLMAQEKMGNTRKLPPVADAKELHSKVKDLTSQLRTLNVALNLLTSQLNKRKGLDGVLRSESRNLSAVEENVIVNGREALVQLKKEFNINVETLIRIAPDQDYLKHFEEEIQSIVGRAPLKRNKFNEFGNIRVGVKRKNEPLLVSEVSFFGVTISYQRGGGSVVRTFTRKDAEILLLNLEKELKRRLESAGNQKSEAVQEALSESAKVIQRLSDSKEREKTASRLLSLKPGSDEGSNFAVRFERNLEEIAGNVPLGGGTFGIGNLTREQVKPFWFGIAKFFRFYPALEYKYTTSFLNIPVVVLHPDQRAELVLNGDTALRLVDRLRQHIDDRRRPSTRSESRVNKWLVRVGIPAAITSIAVVLGYEAVFTKKTVEKEQRPAIEKVERPQELIEKEQQLAIEKIEPMEPAIALRNSIEILREAGFKELSKGSFIKDGVFFIRLGEGEKGYPVQVIFTKLGNVTNGIKAVDIDTKQFNGPSLKLFYKNGGYDVFDPPSGSSANGVVSNGEFDTLYTQEELRSNTPLKDRLVKIGFHEAVPNTGIFERAFGSANVALVYQNEEIVFIGKKTNSVRYQENPRIKAHVKHNDDFDPEGIELQSGPLTYEITPHGRYLFKAWDASVERNFPLKDWQKHTERPNQAGFVIGSINTNQTIDKLTELTGIPMKQIEEVARPGRSSRAGFLDEEESLKTVLRADNTFVRSQGLTHQQLAAPLFYVMNLMEHAGPGADNKESVVFSYKKQKYEASWMRYRGIQTSIFDDHLTSNLDFKVKNIQTGRSLKFSGLVIPYIWRYGFYEGNTPYRVEPSDIIEVFQLKPDRSEARNLSPDILATQLKQNIETAVRFDINTNRAPEGVKVKQGYKVVIKLDTGYSGSLAWIQFNDQKRFNFEHGYEAIFNDKTGELVLEPNQNLQSPNSPEEFQNLEAAVKLYNENSTRSEARELKEVSHVLAADDRPEVQRLLGKRRALIEIMSNPLPDNPEKRRRVIQSREETNWVSLNQVDDELAQLVETAPLGGNLILSSRWLKNGIFDEMNSTLTKEEDNTRSEARQMNNSDEFNETVDFKSIIVLQKTIQEMVNQFNKIFSDVASIQREVGIDTFSDTTIPVIGNLLLMQDGAPELALAVAQMTKSKFMIAIAPNGVDESALAPVRLKLEKEGVELLIVKSYRAARTALLQREKRDKIKLQPHLFLSASDSGLLDKEFWSKVESTVFNQKQIDMMLSAIKEMVNDYKSKLMTAYSA